MEGGSEGHLLLRLRAVRVAEADGVDACSSAVGAWVGALAYGTVECPVRAVCARTPLLRALIVFAFVGRVEGKRALHLPLRGIHVVA